MVLVTAGITAALILNRPPTPGPTATPPGPTTRSPTATTAAPSPTPTVDPGTPGRCGTVPTRARRELRGMWLASVRNLDWPSRPGLAQSEVKREYRRWLDLAQRFNHNAIVVQVRPSGDALWPSAYAPWSQWLTGRRDGTDPGWDPLAFLVEETHARGMEFHAWFNPYRGGSAAAAGGPGTDLTKLAPGHPLRENPEWAIAYPDDPDSGSLYFDPGNPDARRHVTDAILDAVARYDLDAVHLDDFFYPYPVAGQRFDDDASFTRYGEGGRAGWRRANVNTFVRELHQRIKELKPWVKFGISPFGIWKNAVADGGAGTNGLESYHAIYADSRRWVESGWVDYVVPQLYWQIGFDRADYAVLLPWWADLTRDTDVHLYIGQADYRVGTGGAWDDPEELSRHLALGRELGVQGDLHFRAGSVRDDALDAQTRYRESFYARPALVPVMEQLPAAPPATPQGLAVEPSAGGETLTWSPVDGAARYAVYRAGAEDAELVAVTGATSFTGPAGGYCVAGLDRAWNEGPVSAPVRG